MRFAVVESFIAKILLVHKEYHHFGNRHLGMSHSSSVLLQHGSLLTRNKLGAACTKLLGHIIWSFTTSNCSVCHLWKPRAHISSLVRNEETLMFCWCIYKNEQSLGTLVSPWRYIRDAKTHSNILIDAGLGAPLSRFQMFILFSLFCSFSFSHNFFLQITSPIHALGILE